MTKETTGYRRFWDKGRRRSEKLILERKSDFGAKKWFWSEKVILERKSDFGAKKWFWSKKCKKWQKVTFCSKITKSAPRRQPGLPLAKNPLQRPTPGKENFNRFYQKYDFCMKIIFVIKNIFVSKIFSASTSKIHRCATMRQTLLEPMKFSYFWSPKCEKFTFS